VLRGCHYATSASSKKFYQFFQGKSRKSPIMRNGAVSLSAIFTNEAVAPV
jgi:hypothetical protein